MLKRFINKLGLAYFLLSGLIGSFIIGCPSWRLCVAFVIFLITSERVLRKGVGLVLNLRSFALIQTLTLLWLVLIGTGKFVFADTSLEETFPLLVFSSLGMLGYPVALLDRKAVFPISTFVFIFAEVLLQTQHFFSITIATIIALSGCYGMRGGSRRNLLLGGGAAGLGYLLWIAVSLQSGLSIGVLASALLDGLLVAICSSFMAFLSVTAAEFLGFHTNLRLIEIGDLNHPLLRRLSLEASGTWNHSILMGMMAEAAAVKVGANGVLCRVGAYFHDIGKICKPAYFVENNSRDSSLHDRLSPYMSALVIKSHVKDGVRLGNEYRLPSSIIDIIKEHHGTSVVRYFYHQAKTKNPEADVNTFRYDGPRPQSVESAIVMLADSVEAASRSLVDPSADQIRHLVNNIIDDILRSGELSNVELTFKQLDMVAGEFVSVLIGIKHQRIAYNMRRS